MPRLKKSIEEMEAFCPDLLYAADPSSTGGSWAGALQPLRNLDHLPELLDDIRHNRPVSTAPGGSTRHRPNCAFRHCQHDWMAKLQPEELLRTFSIRLYYAGGREDPRCFVEGITMENGRHMWRDGSICPFLSSKDIWDWTRETVADFIGHVSVFLISWMVFHQTGVWIAGEHQIDPAYHLRTIKPHELCWCRSGRKYRKCHMVKDHADAIARQGRS